MLFFASLLYGQKFSEPMRGRRRTQLGSGLTASTVRRENCFSFEYDRVFQDGSRELIDFVALCSALLLYSRRRRKPSSRDCFGGGGLKALDPYNVKA